jgi:hypothetical protein
MENQYLVSLPWTLLQYYDRFWSRISYQRTTWEHWGILVTLLTWLQLIFTFPLDSNLKWRDGVFEMILSMRRKCWIDSHKIASRNVSNTFTSPYAQHIHRPFIKSFITIFIIILNIYMYIEFLMWTALDPIRYTYMTVYYKFYLQMVFFKWWHDDDCIRSKQLSSLLINK